MQGERLIAVFFFTLPVVLLAALVLGLVGIFRAPLPGRRSGVRMAAGSLIFYAADVLFLLALPRLGISYGPAGFSSIVLFLVRAGLLVVLAGLLLRLKSPSARGMGAAFWALNGLLSLLVIYCFAIEPFNLRVTHLTLTAPPGTLSRPVRILQLSDIHVERTTRREQRLPGVVRREHPDVILLTGDYLNLSYLEDPVALADANRLFAQLDAPYGVYAVNGTVEKPPQLPRLFANTKVMVLDDQVRRVPVAGGGLALVGLSNWSYARDAEELEHLTPGQGAYSILLYHTPDLAAEAARAGMDLYLAGHTHGGQVRLPWYGALVTFSRHGKQYEAGRYQVGGTTLYVSRGIGMEGSFAPRVRFLTPPEIVVIDVYPAPGGTD